MHLLMNVGLVCLLFLVSCVKPKENSKDDWKNSGTPDPCLDTSDQDDTGCPNSNIVRDTTDTGVASPGNSISESEQRVPQISGERVGAYDVQEKLLLSLEKSLESKKSSYKPEILRANFKIYVGSSGVDVGAKQKFCGNVLGVEDNLGRSTQLYSLPERELFSAKEAVKGLNKFCEAENAEITKAIELFEAIYTQFAPSTRHAVDFTRVALRSYRIHREEVKLIKLANEYNASIEAITRLKDKGEITTEKAEIWKQPLLSASEPGGFLGADKVHGYYTVKTKPIIDLSMAYRANQIPEQRQALQELLQRSGASRYENLTSEMREALCKGSMRLADSVGRVSVVTSETKKKLEEFAAEIKLSSLGCQI